MCETAIPFFFLGGENGNFEPPLIFYSLSKHFAFVFTYKIEIEPLIADVKNITPFGITSLFSACTPEPEPLPPLPLNLSIEPQSRAERIMSGKKMKIEKRQNKRQKRAKTFCLVEKKIFK